MGIEIITTIEQQKEVYFGLKNDKESAERWESLMRIVAGLDDKTIAVIKGEN